MEQYKQIEELRDKLDRIGVLITDSHVVYTAGDHGSAYFNKDALMKYPYLNMWLGKVIAGYFRDQDIDVVAAPAVAGALLAQMVAFQLNEYKQRTDILAVYADKTAEGFKFGRDFAKDISDKKVLLVEDVLNSGDSARKVVQCVRDLAGNVVGMGTICNRGGQSPVTMLVPDLYSVFEFTMDKYPADKCLLCARGVPINTSVGHGQNFLDAQKKKQ